MRVETEQRPRRLTEGAAESFDGDTHSLANTADVPLVARRAEFGVLVTAQRRDGVVTQQVMRNLGAAERKRDRCLAAGLRCELLLVRLVPIGIELDTTTVPSSVLEIFDNNEISMSTEVV